MCGIAGIISPSSIHTERIRDAIAAIYHRGPDETGFFLGEKCHLGIARLSIVDVREGHQPCFNENKDVISVFNGEIYNFRELRELLLKKGHFLASNSDSELVPHLYEEFGEEFPKKLQGMFAIALYVKSQNKLLLVRDRLGKKPIWFSNQNGSIFFCSELKGLFSLGVKKTFDASILSEYLSSGYVNAPRSPFKNVEQVKPGSYVRFYSGTITSVSYWRPEDISEDPISWNDAIEKGHELIKMAVRERLFSERPLGVFLSGGVDSTLVAAMAIKELGKLETFSIGFEESDYDESSHAHDLSDILETKHHVRIVTPNPLLILEEITKMLDQPFADSSIIPSFILSKFAREKVVVALSGDGGDEAFGGYDRYRANHYLSHLNPIIKLNPLRFFSSKINSESRNGKLLRGLIQSDSHLRYLELQANVPWQTVAKLTKSNFVIDDAERFIDLSDLSSPSNFKTMQIVDIKSYLPGDLLFKVDMASMANGLEVRSPLLDYRVVEFGLSLPRKYKVTPNLNKVLLREILKRYVPARMINRSKRGFAIPRARWIREELRPLIMETLVANNAWLNFHLDQKQISRIVKRHMDGSNHDATIWTLLMLELWAQKWLND